MTLAQAAALIVAIGFIGWREYSRVQTLDDEGVRGLEGFSYIDLQSTPYIILFLLLPLAWLQRTAGFSIPAQVTSRWACWFGAETKPGHEGAKSPDDAMRATLLALVVAAVSFVASFYVASCPVQVGTEYLPMYQLPPVFQDEYSYLLQARTFAAGRWWFPSYGVHPELFDQMHVVNNGRYASRYFPATGAWIMPFLLLGLPYLGHWLAGAVSATLVFAAGRELGGNGVGFLAGMLTAVSPGMAVFSNLLLAHHPALLGLLLFLYFFLRMLRTGRWWCALVAGCGLSFGMLARPMTAFGFGLPFGVAFGLWLCRRYLWAAASAGEVQSAEPRHKPASRSAAGMAKHSGSWYALQLIAAMGLPILGGMLIIGWQNRTIIGDWLTTPYRQFNDIYTPRHVYGFHNVQRAEQRIARGEVGQNDVFEKYDRWAKDLTPALAAENVLTRLVTSWRFTLASVPLLLAGIVFVFWKQSDEPRWWLIPAAICSLHAVHVPYWFVGILNWHYVFETAPLWLLVFARATQLLFAHWKNVRRHTLPCWWVALTATAIGFGYISPDNKWIYSESPVDDAVTKMSFMKRRYYSFHKYVNSIVGDSQALVLVEEDPDQIHFEYVQNHPDLGHQRILIGRFRPGRTDIEEIIKAFPRMGIYLWYIKENAYEVIRSGDYK